MKFKLSLLLLLTALQVSVCCALAQSPIAGDIRIVIGSTSPKGDTYLSAATLQKSLEKKIGVKVTLDAVGYKKAFEAIQSAGEDGTTLMVFHDYAYLGYLYGVDGFKDPFQSYTVGPLLAINPGNAYLVPKSTPYWTIHDVIDACGNGTKVRIAIQKGGVSEIGFTALQHAIKVKYPGKEHNLVAVESGSQKEKNQLLFEGKVDLIYGTVVGNEKYTKLPVYDPKAMRFVWLTSRMKMMELANPEGFGKTSRDSLLKFMEPYTWVPYDLSSNFTFDKEYFFLYNKNIKPDIVSYLDQVLTELYAEGEVVKLQKDSFYIPNFMPSTKAQDYLKKKSEYIKGIIAGLKD